jgi:hypothetical protein
MEWKWITLFKLVFNHVISNIGANMSQDNLIAPDNLVLKRLSNAFENAASELFTPGCPLYVELSEYVARDSDLLALSAYSRPGQAPAVLLLYSVHYLLLRGEKHPLSEFYSSLTSPPAPPKDAPPVFADFCRKYIREIKQLLQTRLVQTNEVRRCALLMPAIVLASQEAGPVPLALVDLGASAGLNLLFDKYGYDYGNGLYCGDLSSPVQLTCTLRGSLRPPIPRAMPDITSRIGIDLNPLDGRKHEDYLWLVAQLWPNDSFKVREERMQAAVELAHLSPPKMIAGDIVEILPEIISEIPADQAICLMHSFSFYELPNEVRAEIISTITHSAAKREILSIKLELSPSSLTIATQLELSRYQRDGKIDTRKLANCHNYGEWMEWLHS